MEARQGGSSDAKAAVVSHAGKAKRLEAVLHAALVDGGFRCDRRTPDRDVYVHCAEPLEAALDRPGLPGLPVAVTLLDEESGRAVGMAAKPDALRVLLGRVVPVRR